MESPRYPGKWKGLKASSFFWLFDFEPPPLCTVDRGRPVSFGNEDSRKSHGSAGIDFHSAADLAPGLLAGFFQIKLVS